MATKKIYKSSKNKKSTNKISKKTKELDSVEKVKGKLISPKLNEQLKISESYVSLAIGAIVVIGIFLLAIIFIFDSRDEVSEQRVLNGNISPTPVEIYIEEYTIQEGESLWDVSVKHYGDGFAWPKIVEENKEIITDPDFVPPGTVIIIPQIN